MQGGRRQLPCTVEAGPQHCHPACHVVFVRVQVALRQFKLRQGSGGTGRWHGGEGIVREVRCGSLPRRPRIFAESGSTPQEAIREEGTADFETPLHVSMLAIPWEKCVRHRKSEGWRLRFAPSAQWAGDLC